MRNSMIALICLVVVGQCALRYDDQSMMKKHHHHMNRNAGDLTIHIVPHSHDDVGWLKTVDDYYYGGRQEIQWAGVQYTIDTVVQQLSNNPSYKFSIVEMAFLYRWWNQATKQQQQTMKKLVANGQLVFINGGWCMSDEATPYYQDFIDQMIIGLRWLRQTFNYVPDVAWHIDPFGHQASSASMFSRMGFNSFFFSRIDYQDKDLRLSNKAMQMIWRPNLVTPDPNNYIFTQVNYYHYSPPPGYCFDVKCLNQPIKDDPNLQDYNLVDKSTNLVNYFKSMALHFRTKNLMHTFGQDFQYANARMWYKNLDKLIKFINDRPQFGMKLIYSTPVDYITAIQLEQQSYPPKTDDFFPYADNPNGYWTGYFVSRTALKGFVRDMGRFVQAARKHVSQLKISNSSQVINDNTQQLQQSIWGLQTAMGILQHHDAVAGTSKQKVADDYILTGVKNINNFNQLYQQIKKQQINKEIGQSVSGDIYFDIYWNTTYKYNTVGDLIAAGKTVLVQFYNPGPKGTYPLRVRVPQSQYNIVTPASTIQGDVICGNSLDTNDCQLHFQLPIQQASNNYVKIIPVKTGGTAKVLAFKQLTSLQPTKQIKLTDTSSIKVSKTLQRFDLTLNGSIEIFMLAYKYYQSYQGSGQKSGAYIFRPANNTPSDFSTITTYLWAQGTQNAYLVLQGTNTNTKLYFSKIKDYVNKYGFIIESYIRSISVADGKGKQVILTLTTTYQNNKTFYTDSNGLEQQKRILNFRPTWPLDVHQPVSGNYYPINSHISIQDVATKKRLTVLTDRSQGGSVIKDGVIEIMVHRRTTMDDSRGVDQPLNEVQPSGIGLRQNMRHYVVFGQNYRALQKMNDQKVMLAIQSTNTNTFAKNNIRKSPIHAPDAVKVYLRPFTDGSYLIRLHNFDTVNQNTVQLDGWTLTELTLSANQLLSDWRKKQYKWNQDKSYTYNLYEDLQQNAKQTDAVSNNGIWQSFTNKFTSIFTKMATQTPKTTPNDAITLKPFEIKTFKMIKA